MRSTQGRSNVKGFSEAFGKNLAITPSSTLEEAPWENFDLITIHVVSLAPSKDGNQDNVQTISVTN